MLCFPEEIHGFHVLIYNFLYVCNTVYKYSVCYRANISWEGVTCYMYNNEDLYYDRSTALLQHIIPHVYMYNVNVFCLT